MIELKILERAMTINLEIVLSKVFKRREVLRFIEKLNKRQLKDDHVDSKNVQLQYKDAKGKVRIGYSPLTQKLSGGRKKAGDPFTLFDTGDFFKSIKAIPELADVEIVSNPIKDNTNLYKKFGKNIVGLDEKSIKELQEFIKPIFQQEVRTYLLR